MPVKNKSSLITRMNTNGKGKRTVHFKHGPLLIKSSVLMKTMDSDNLSRDMIMEEDGDSHTMLTGTR